jgi:hypothetical protein
MRSIASCSAGFMALRFFGRFITTVVTPLYFSTLTTSVDAWAIPRLHIGNVFSQL